MLRMLSTGAFASTSSRASAVTPSTLAASISFGWLLHFLVPQPLPLIPPPPGALASAIHHFSTFRRAPRLVRLDVALPGASPPSSRHNSSQCRLLLHPFRLAGLPHCHCPVAYHTDGYRVASQKRRCLLPPVRLRLSIATVLGVVCQLPPLPPPHPSRATSSSPGRGPEEIASPSG